MPQTVNVPGVGQLQFPDGMSQQDMAAAIQHNFPQIHGAQQQAQPTAMPNPDPQNIQQVQQNADQAQSNDIDKLKAIGRGFVNTLEQGTNSELDPAARQAATGQVDQAAGLGKPTPGLGEFLGGMASPLPGTSGVQGLAGKAAEPGLSLGQLTQNPAIQWLESKLAYLPGGGDIVKSLSQQTQRLGQHVSDIVDSLRTGKTALPEDAGQSLATSLTNAQARIKLAAGSQFDAILDKIPNGAKIPVTNTANTLEDLTAIPTGAQQTGAQLVDPRLSKLHQALTADIQAGGGSLPIDTVRRLKTMLGSMVQWDGRGDAVNGALKQVYGSLTQDISTGARAVDPTLAPMIAKANSGYQVATAQMDVLQGVINKAGGTENIFNSLMAGTKDGSLTLRRVLTQLSPTDRQLLAATQLRRMGLASPGVQGAAGEAFSADTFLTNWNKMAPDALEALFGRLPAQYADNITRIAKSAEQLKSYGRLVRMNTSGTTPTMIGAGEVGGAIMGLITGHPGAAAAIGGSAAATKVLGLALTNPKTAAWLATAFPRYVSQFLPSALKSAGAAQTTYGNYPGPSR